MLVRGAFPKFRDPLTPDELAGLALEDGIHARLVMEKGGRRPWQVDHGPFAAKRLQRLPKSHWTLLVSNVDQFVPAAAELLDLFNFIPQWRADDVMVSFAPEQGSVGPHVDSYDVFLIQGMGRRRWQIAEKFNPELVDGIDLRILRRFKAQQEWVLEPGDMLYLPPGVAHYGVALGECLTYSVGFRAPAQAAMIDHFFNLPEELAQRVRTPELYRDPDLGLQKSPGEVTAAAVERVTAMLRAPLADKELMARWFAAFVTRPDSFASAAEARRRPPASAVVLKRLAAGRDLARSDACRLAFVDGAAKAFFVYAGGDELPVDAQLKPLVRVLCESRSIAASAALAALPRAKDTRAAGAALLAELMARGALIWA